MAIEDMVFHDGGGLNVSGEPPGAVDAGTIGARRRRRRPLRVEVLGVIDEPGLIGWPMMLVCTHDADGQISLRQRTLKRTGELARGATVIVTKVDEKGRAFVMPFTGYKDVGWVLKWFIRCRELPSWQRGKDRKWHRRPLLSKVQRER